MAQISVGNIIDQVQRLANRVDPQYRGRVLEAVNRALVYHSERLPIPSWERVETFRANGTAFFVFPRRVRVLRTVLDLERDDYVGPGASWERQYPTLIDDAERVSSNFFEWTDRGFVPVIQAPSTDSTIIPRFSASNATMSVYVKGLIRDTTASGTALELIEADEQIQVGDTSGVTSANEYAEILGIEKDTVSGVVADIIVDYARGDNTQGARVLNNERSPRYLRIEWLAKPAAGDRFRARYFTAPNAITSELEVLDPAVEVDFLTWRAVGDYHWVLEQPDAAQAAWGRADQMLEIKLTAQQEHGDRNIQAIPFAPFIEDDPEDIWF